MKKRDVFLFGAGSVIDWKGPSTYELTKRVRNLGLRTQSGEYVTDIIYRTLVKECNLQEEDVNFETIISVIEELIVYYAGYSSPDNKLSLTSPFLIPSSLLQELMPLPPKDESKQLVLGTTKFRLIFEGDDTPEQHALKELLLEITCSIMADVMDYSFYSRAKRGTIENETNKDLNDSFANWIKSSLLDSKLVRLYTLNYDRLFKIVLENRGVSLFEGFNNNGAAIDYNAYHKPDLKSLYNHDLSCHYNLHGSASWSVSTLNKQNLPSHEYFLSLNGPLPSGNSDIARVQVEKGKNIILTPIITGYQKTQKSAVTPFKQMQAAFDKDCMFASNLFIIGYSFGDAHINESIRNALKENEELQVTIVDPSFIKDNKYSKLWLDLFSHTSYIPEPISREKEDKGLYTCLKGRVKVYTKNFKDFLSEFASLG